MASLMITLAMISLMASCLQLCLPKPVDIPDKEKKLNSSGSGFWDMEISKNNMTGSGSGDDDEDYSGSTSIRPRIFTQEEIWQMFILFLQRTGLNMTEILNYNA